MANSTERASTQSVARVHIYVPVAYVNKPVHEGAYLQRQCYSCQAPAGGSEEVAPPQPVRPHLFVQEPRHTIVICPPRNNGRAAPTPTPIPIQGQTMSLIKTCTEIHVCNRRGRDSSRVGEGGMNGGWRIPIPVLKMERGLRITHAQCIIQAQP